MITPPFTQLNTPYPATAYLKGFLNTKNIPSTQSDLGIEVIGRLFCQEGLKRLFDTIEEGRFALNPNCRRMVSLKATYLQVIEPVIGFLQDKDPTLAHLICTGNYLPEAARFEQIADLEWAFGTMGSRDRARHLATLFLEDIGDLVVHTVDPLFGFSRYAERLGSSAYSFDELYTSLQEPPTFIDELTLAALAALISRDAFSLVCLSVPFPGNLYSALRCGQYIKAHFPGLKVCMGGGYPNTELRSLKDKRVFEFLDFITLDDGEAPLVHLLEHLEGKRSLDFLKRTFTLAGDSVSYFNGSAAPDYKQAEAGTPDYGGLALDRYLSVIEVANPMHRLWSDGRWNKLTLAHGCYWGKCTFCDISLDYIKNYESATAKMIADRMEHIVRQTGQSGFHFVDEAAPPVMMREVALEILRRGMSITWWANIRFEKSFTADLCRLLAASGCIAVSGGLEVASDRLLKLIDKGVTVAQVTRVSDHFTNAGIMVHAYLMYGFPTQTAQETIDSLEVVRQLFMHQVLQSGFWHRFAMTAHSPIGMQPELFGVKKEREIAGAFANNDIPHSDPDGCDHPLFSEGLRKSLFNYMHGMCFDFDLQEWFDFEVPATTIPADHIETILKETLPATVKPGSKLIWLGSPAEVTTVPKNQKHKGGPICRLTIYSKREQMQLELPEAQARSVAHLLETCRAGAAVIPTLATLRSAFATGPGTDFNAFLDSAAFDALRDSGLLLI